LRQVDTVDVAKPAVERLLGGADPGERGGSHAARQAPGTV
jgi:hypothetical protein